MTFIYRFILVFSCFIWGTSTFSFALDPSKEISQYCVKSWDIDSGLPCNCVFAITQTIDGYLWLGTQDGLVRFDGINFEIFDRDRVSELEDNVIRALYPDKEGGLWIGTGAGGLTRLENEKFHTYSTTNYPALNRISSINSDKWGNTWIGSYKEGLTCFSKGKFTTYTTRDGLPDRAVTTLYRDNTGDLWIVTARGIVRLLEPGKFSANYYPNIESRYLNAYFYDPQKREAWIGTGDNSLFYSIAGRTTPYGQAPGFPHPTITTLFADKAKNLWIGSDGGGLNRWQSAKGLISRQASREGANSSLTSGSIYSIYEDDASTLWLGTLEGGLHQLTDPDFTVYSTREGLAHDYVCSIYESRSGMTWIGTQDGVDRFSPSSGSIDHLPWQELTHQPVLAIAEDTVGNLWFGTPRGLYCYQRAHPAGNPVTGKLTLFTKQNGLPASAVNHIWIDEGPSDNLWVGTKNGLKRIQFQDNDMNKNQVTNYSSKQGLSNDCIENIFRDSHGTLWVGTAAGLNRSLDNENFEKINIDGALSSSSFLCTYECAGGLLWFGSESGLYLFHPGQQNSSAVSTGDSSPGKSHCPVPVNHLTRLTMRCGLVENHVYTIMEDDQGYLWLGGRKGISRIKKSELEAVAAGKIETLHTQPQIFNEKYGMRSRWCTSRGCRTRDGRFWFPTARGVAVIHPLALEKRRPSPAPVIQELIVDGEAMPMHVCLGNQKKKKNWKHVELPPGTRRLEFRYTAITFLHPQETQFKIKLEGYDSDWIEMGNTRNTTYTGLPPGKYKFRVTAAQPGSPWHPGSVVISLNLLPYFYQTTWFYFLVGFFITSFALLLHFFRVRRLRRREMELSSLVAQRTQDLAQRNLQLEQAQEKITRSRDLISDKNHQLEEQSAKLKEMDKLKSRFFANISHEFRTPLTLIMGPLEQMLTDCEKKKKGDEKQKKKYKLMLRNAQRLLGLINQLLELSKFESGGVKLQVVRTNIVSLVKGTSANFEPLCDHNELELEVRAQEENITAYIDPRSMESVIGNLLINAVKFTPAGGKITITVRRLPTNNPLQVKTDQVKQEQENATGCVEIRVADTGPGISKEQLPYIFDRFYQSDVINEQQSSPPGNGTRMDKGTTVGTGIGLAIVKESIQLHNGTIDVTSREGKGTEFIIVLPLGEAHLPANAIINEEKSEGEEIVEPLAPQLSETGMLFHEDEKERASSSQDDFFQDAIVAGSKKDIVLVVEDSADIREYIRGALEEHYHVEEAADGNEGLEKAQQYIPDLIISDVMMPGLDGFELCRKLKQDIETSHIPIILLTAKASEESMVEGLEIGADDYIIKPFSTTILTAKIKNLIELRRQLHLTVDREMTSQPTEISISAIDRKFFKKLRQVIEENLGNTEMNVEFLANHLAMDRSTLYRKVQALTGSSPTEFIRTCRLKQAVELLKTNKYSVMDIAFEVGFSSAGYFTRCFKEKFHRLPSELLDSSDIE